MRSVTTSWASRVIVALAVLAIQGSPRADEAGTAGGSSTSASGGEQGAGSSSSGSGGSSSSTGSSSTTSSDRPRFHIRTKTVVSGVRGYGEGEQQAAAESSEGGSESTSSTAPGNTITTSGNNSPELTGSSTKPVFRIRSKPLPGGVRGYGEGEDTAAESNDTASQSAAPAESTVTTSGNNSPELAGSSTRPVIRIRSKPLPGGVRGFGAAGCQADSECKDGRRCVDGACADADEDPAPPPAPNAAQSKSPPLPRPAAAPIETGGFCCKQSGYKMCTVTEPAAVGSECRCGRSPQAGHVCR